MPKEIQKYRCVFCKQEHATYEGCFRHEAAHHLRIMPETVKAWLDIRNGGLCVREPLAEFEKGRGLTIQEHEKLEQYARMMNL